MKAETYQAIKAVIERDPTMPNQERTAILQACKNLKTEKPDKKPTLALLTTRQVAEILQVSTRTVRRMNKNGLLHSIKLSARLIRYRADEVDRVIQALTV